ncbi:MAG: hypothetical protein U0T81_01530 [Saprospiraceae bacterium]
MILQIETKVKSGCPTSMAGDSTDIPVFIKIQISAKTYFGVNHCIPDSVQFNSTSVEMTPDNSVLLGELNL